MTFIELEIPVPEMEEFISWCNANLSNGRGIRYHSNRQFGPPGGKSGPDVQEQAVQVNSEQDLMHLRLRWSQYFRPTEWMRNTARWELIKLKQMEATR